MCSFASFGLPHGTLSHPPAEPRASALSRGQRHRKDKDILVLYRGSNGNRSLDIFAICGEHFFSGKQRIAQFTLKMALLMHMDCMCIKVNMM